jgi:RNA polymerase sigma factor (sigma-70 family)
MAAYRLNDFDLLAEVQAFLVQPGRGPYAPRELKRSWLSFEGRVTPFFRFWLRRFGVDRDDLEDALQQSWVVAIRELPAFVPRGERSLSGWLWRIARAQAGQVRRRGGSRPCRILSAAQLAALPDCHADASLSAQVREFQERLQRAIDEIRPTLSERDRTILDECLLRGRPRIRVAAEVGIAPETVYDVVRRLRRKLGRLVREAGDS